MGYKKRNKELRGMCGWIVSIGEWAYSNAVGLLGVVTGIPALFWQIIDRRKGKRLIASIRSLQDRTLNFTPEGYVPLEISFWNDNPFAVILTEIAICNVTSGDITLGMTVDETSSRYYLKQRIRPQQAVHIYKYIPPYVSKDRPITTGTEVFPDIFFVSYDALRAGGNVLDIRITYHGTNRNRKDRSIMVKGVYIAGATQTAMVMSNNLEVQ